MTIRFGVFAPQGWKTELGGLDGAPAQWDKAKEVARTAERLGFDSLWVYDHFHPIPNPASGDPVFECWTTMAALTEVTSSIRLGQMVTCNSYRSPALLAKMAATVDVMSGGRLDLGIGAGWYAHEYWGYGFEFEEPKVRLGQLREAVQIIPRLWTEERVDFDGEHYTLRDARCDPKPLQSPRPAIWVGGGGEQVTLRIVARYADCSNFGGKPDEFRHKCEVLQRHCEQVGRDYGEIRKTWHPDVLVAETEADVARLVDARMAKWGPITKEPEESWRAGHLVGTPEQVADRIGTYSELGVSEIVMWSPDYPSTESIEVFAEQVIPRLRGSD